jgi:hypothetical protein
MVKVAAMVIKELDADADSFSFQEIADAAAAAGVEDREFCLSQFVHIFAGAGVEQQLQDAFNGSCFGLVTERQTA